MAGGRERWNEMYGENNAAWAVCVLGEGDGYGGGQRIVSSQRAHERQENLRNGQKCQGSKKSIWTFLPFCVEKAFPFKVPTQAFSNSRLQGA